MIWLLFLLLLPFTVSTQSSVSNGRIIQYSFDLNQDMGIIPEQHDYFTTTIPDTSGITPSSLSIGNYFRYSIDGNSGNNWCRNSIGLSYNTTMSYFHRGNSVNTIEQLSSKMITNEMTIELWIRIYNHTLPLGYPVDLLSFTSQNKTAPNVAAPLYPPHLSSIYINSSNDAVYITIPTTTSVFISPSFAPNQSLYKRIPYEKVIQLVVTVSTTKVRYYWRGMDPMDSYNDIYVNLSQTVNLTKLFDATPLPYLAIAPSYVNGASQYTFKGEVYKFTMYDRVLNDAEILYNWVNALSNSAPVILISSLNHTILEDVPFTLSWTNYDFDNNDLFRLQTVQTRIISITGYGTLTNTVTGQVYTSSSTFPILLDTNINSLQYLNTPHVIGIDILTVTLDIIDGITTGRQVVIVFNVIHVNHPPTAFNSTHSSALFSNVSIELTGVDFDTGDTYIYSITKLPDCGRLYATNGTLITFVPYHIIPLDPYVIHEMHTIPASNLMTGNRTSTLVTCKFEYVAIDTQLASTVYPAVVSMDIANPIITGYYIPQFDIYSYDPIVLIEDQPITKILLRGYDKYAATHAVTICIHAISSKITLVTNNTLTNTLTYWVYENFTADTYFPSTTAYLIIPFPDYSDYLNPFNFIFYSAVSSGMEGATLDQEVAVTHKNDPVYILPRTLTLSKVVKSDHETYISNFSVQVTDVDSDTDTFMTFISSVNNTLRFTLGLIDQFSPYQYTFIEGDGRFDKVLYYETNRLIATKLLESLYVTCPSNVDGHPDIINITIYDHNIIQATTTKDTVNYTVHCDPNLYIAVSSVAGSSDDIIADNIGKFTGYIILMVFLGVGTIVAWVYTFKTYNKIKKNIELQKDITSQEIEPETQL